MRKEEIIKIFKDFISGYDEANKTDIWRRHSQSFRDFWKNKVLNNDVREIKESEVDQIIKILDIHAKGHTRRDESVGKIMIAQGVWRRMFKEIKGQSI